MPEKHLFEYAVIRVVPRVEREEFINVGVILYCPAQRFLQTIFELDELRLKALSAQVDLQELQKRLCVFELICTGKKEGGIIGQLTLAERFRWLTAARSTVIQTSAVHPGLCSDAAEMLVHLHTQLVK
ncbi:MAG: DUF3037 domain-containing protein [Spirosomataceae bacterium]